MSAEISIPVWWSNGHMMFKRDCLDWDHPEQTYNYVKREYGVAPEEYGIDNPAPCRRPTPTLAGEEGT